MLIYLVQRQYNQKRSIYIHQPIIAMAMCFYVFKLCRYR